jgi:PIN domain nuclease of toxin-antitoxin system
LIRGGSNKERKLLTANEIEIPLIYLRHVEKLRELPPIHRDPFDRILVAQSVVDDLVLMTADPAVASYPRRTVTARPKK